MGLEQVQRSCDTREAGRRSPRSLNTINNAQVSSGDLGGGNSMTSSRGSRSASPRRTTVPSRSFASTAVAAVQTQDPNRACRRTALDLSGLITSQRQAQLYSTPARVITRQSPRLKHRALMHVACRRSTFRQKDCDDRPKFNIERHSHYCTE